MIEQSSSPQQFSEPNDWRGSRWPRPEGVELAAVPLEAEDEIMIMEVTDEVLEDWGLEV